MSNTKTDSAMQIMIDEIPVIITRKKIKNLYLRVKSNGIVSVSAPLHVNDEQVAAFVQKKHTWILDKMKCHKTTQTSNADVMYLWGETYTLVIVASESKKRFCIDTVNKQVHVFLPLDYPSDKREKYIAEIYRQLLKEKLAVLMPIWEEKTGLYCTNWHVKKMKTRWGSCNTKEKRIWISLQLVQKPVECLEYIILHELMHLQVPNHSKTFYNALQIYMPDWKKRKELLHGTACNT